MEIVIFFAFIAICAFALVWASRKTRSETDLAARKRAERNASRAEKLAAPGDALLSHGDQVWQSRRQHASTGIEPTNRFQPKSESHGEPMYDGYSRRDRHHVRENKAKIHESIDDDNLTMTAIQVEPDAVKTDKAAS